MWQEELSEWTLLCDPVMWLTFSLFSESLNMIFIILCHQYCGKMSKKTTVRRVSLQLQHHMCITHSVGSSNISRYLYFLEYFSWYAPLNINSTAAPREILYFYTTTVILHQKCLWDGSTPFRCGVGGAVSDRFCNFPKPPTGHSQLVHAVIGRLCRGEEGATVWTSLSALFTTICVTLWMSSWRKCEVWAVILVFKWCGGRLFSPPSGVVVGHSLVSPALGQWFSASWYWWTRRPLASVAEVT